VFDQVEYQLGWDADKAIYRIVYDFVFIQWAKCCAKMLNYSNIPFYNC
jgi:hypothetical protein